MEGESALPGIGHRAVLLAPISLAVGTAAPLSARWPAAGGEADVLVRGEAYVPPDGRELALRVVQDVAEIPRKRSSSGGHSDSPSRRRRLSRCS